MRDERPVLDEKNVEQAVRSASTAPETSTMGQRSDTPCRWTVRQAA